MIVNEATGMRQRILQEATRLFTHSGYNAISMREIAAACGITKAALYYHFRDKEALMVAILSGYLADMGPLISGCCASVSGARARLENFIRAIFAQPPEQRAIIRLGIQEISNLSMQARADFARLYQDEFIGPLTNIFAEGVRRGELRDSDSHQVVWLLLGMMYPFFYPSQERLVNPETVIDLLINVFFDGMAIHD